ncbi:MAG: 23S rRNA (guanosine(2251)-2'-O)-methyltransferase RlmB [Bacteroidota bacterium]
MAANKTLIYGRHPVLEALESGQTMEMVLLQQGTRGELEKSVRRLTKAQNIPLKVVPKERLNRLTGGNHQGLIGFLSLLPYYRLEDVLPGIYEQSGNPLIVLLDGVTDVRNIGAIARSAECMGAQALVIPLKGTGQLNADAIKSSAGALNRITVCRERSLVTAIQLIKDFGIGVYASDLKANKLIDQIDFSGPSAIVIGSEGEGVSSVLLKAASETFVIPQRGQTDSLNASVAAGVILYEADRQRRQ